MPIYPISDKALQTEATCEALIEAIQEWGVFRLNPDGEILSWNPGAERMYGYTAEEIIGDHWRIFYPAAERQTQNPELDLKDAARQGRIEIEGWRIKKDGTRYRARLVIVRIPNDAVPPDGFWVITKDLTTRRADELRYRMLVEGVTDYAIFSLDSSGIITSWNRGAERIKGYTEEEIIGRHFSLFYTPEDLEIGLPEKVLKTADEQGHYTGEGWRVRKGGARFWCSLVVTALRDDDGHLVGFSKITRDMTDRKVLLDRIQRHAEELEIRVRERDQTNAELEAFSYSVSHDLKAPVRAIDGFAQALKEDAWDKLNESERDYVDQVAAAAGRMSMLIQDLLEYSHLGRTPLDLTKLTVRNCVKEAIADLTPGAAIRTSIDPALQVIANGLVLERVIANLAGNAIKFHRPGEPPKIKITAATRGGLVRISVVDKGIGIAPEHQKRIFEVFQRLHTQEEYPGTGIGLAIVKRGISRMGGQFGLESNAGQGSTFWIELPASKE